MSLAEGTEIRSCATNRKITVGGNVYKSLIKVGYVPVRDEKTGELKLDHPTTNNKCHPRRGVTRTGSPVRKSKKSKKSSTTKAARAAKVAAGEPLRPKNSFQLFQAAYLAQELGRLGAAAYKAMNKRQAVSAAWAAASPTTRARFEREAAALAAQYKADVASFESRGGVRTPRASKGTPRARGRKVSPTKAALVEAVGKRPISGFFAFSQDMRPSWDAAFLKKYKRQPGVTERAKGMKVLWESAANAAVRENYNADAAERMAAYKAKKSQYVGVAPKRQGFKNQYIIFSQEQRPLLQARYPAAKPTEVTKMIGEMWRSMSAAQKAPYVARVVRAAARSPKRSQVEKALEVMMAQPAVKARAAKAAKRLSPKEKAAVMSALSGRVSPAKAAALLGAEDLEVVPSPRRRSARSPVDLDLEEAAGLVLPARRAAPPAMLRGVEGGLPARPGKRYT